jgi:hypothetical protein
MRGASAPERVAGRKTPLPSILGGADVEGIGTGFPQHTSGGNDSTAILARAAFQASNQWPFVR